jgi:foldase protein PrsA
MGPSNAASSCLTGGFHSPKPALTLRARIDTLGDMKLHRPTAHTLAAALAVALLAATAGCGNADNGDGTTDSDVRMSAVDANRPALADTAMPVGTDAPSDANGPVMATVKGQPIPMDRLHRILVRTEGLQIAMQLIVNELVEQEAAKHDISVNEEDLQREAQETIARGFGGQDLTAQQREALLEQYLRQRGISKTQWDLTMYRNALLGKLLARKVEVSEEQLRDEFNRRFGRQVVVRHIEVSSLNEARSVLQKLKSDGDFAKLARNHSINPSGKDGGLLPPISAKTIGVPPAMRSVAVSMDEVGEISDPVKIETSYHILKLEKVVPPKDVEFEQKKDELRKIVRSRLVNQRKQAYLGQLYAKAFKEGKIRFVNPILRKQFKQRSRQGASQ